MNKRMRTLNGNIPQCLEDYYNPMADNYLIPQNEMTDDIMTEILDLIYEKPYSPMSDYGSYFLMRWDDDEMSYWCVTSWIE